MSLLSQKNQSFRTVDLLIVVSLVATVGVIIAVVFSQTLRDNRAERAQAVAESLALQLKDLNLRSQGSVLGKRGPASAESSNVELMSGKISRDPWGQPFNYSIRQSNQGEHNEGGPKARVFVWSAGPNGEPEADLDRLVARGDDIVHIEDFSIGGP
jgi:type II secretory pathway pseudopilin PulG